MGTISSSKPKWQWKTSAIVNRRSQDLSCYRKCKQQRFYLYRNRQARQNDRNLLSLTTDFPPEKVIFAIGKCRRILVTIHGTTDAIYTRMQCLQKHYQPGYSN